MVTPDRYNGFTFDGVDSKTYGVFITDVKVFGAPVRDVESVSIPGRNGDLLIDHGRWENIDVVYSAVIHDLDNFTTIMAYFRAALASKIGYKRLSDDINIGEYRLATFKDGLDVSTLNKKTGQFDITFNCKPQRYLLEGETPRLLVQNMVPSSTKTETGSIVSIESDGGDAVTSLIAQIDPVQSGSGDPSPENVRPITGWTATNVFDTSKNLVDESTAIGSNASVTVDGGYISVTKNGSSNYPAAHIDAYLRAGVTYTVSATCVQATEQAKLAIRDIAPSGTAVTSVAYSADGQRKSVTYTPTKSGMYRVALFSSFGAGDSNTAIFTDIQCEIGNTATAYEPYTGHTTTTALGRTVYGGRHDIVTGVLAVTHAMVDLGSLTWNVAAVGGAPYFLSTPVSGCKIVDRGQSSAICEMYATYTGNLTPFSRADAVVCVAPSAFSSATARIGVRDTRYTDAASFKSAVSGVKLVYELATQQTYNLTAQEVSTLLGLNNMWADTGDITLTYCADPYKVINPTLFASKPLLRVTGRGTLSVGDVTMTITGTASQVLYIDCDIMEVYSITDGQMAPQNSLVTISGNEYPALQPGATQITLGSGITQVVITPRWWRI